MQKAGTGRLLDDHERAEIARVNAAIGTERAARHFGVSREVIARAIAGLGLRNGTIALFRAHFPAAASRAA